MRTLLLLRHAKSSWESANVGDHDRPLNKRGKAAALRMGSFMSSHDLMPELVLASSARRAQATVHLWQQASGFSGPVQTCSELYLAEPAAYLGCLRSRAEQQEIVMCVGHNPGLEQLLKELTGHDERLPTAALAKLRVPIERWAQIDARAEAELVNVWRVKELPT